MAAAEDTPAVKKNPVMKVAAFIVDKRKAFYLLYIGLAIFSLFSSGWVAVNDDLTSYLPADTETRQGLTCMEDQFVTFGTNRIMVDNISFERGELLQEEIEKIPGVTSAEFDNTEDHYRSGAALFSITYDGTAEDQVSLDALQQVEDLLAPYDTYVTGETGNSMSATLDEEMQVVIVVAVVIIVVVLLFTSQTYMEVPVLLATFGLAALLNKGTNFLLGEISFVSNSVAVVLQLALAIDYAIILCHRYSEEREHLEARDAVITALSKSIPEISGSSLTTLSGLGALCFMQFGIGRDLGIVLMKAILLSLLSVFTFMPGLLMSFSSLIDRTHHRNFVPKISGLGRLVVKLRYVLPPLFLIALVGGFYFSSRCPYAFTQTGLSTFTKNDAQIAEEKVNETFSPQNTLAVLVKAGDYEREGRLLKELKEQPEVESVLGLANVEARDGYVLTEGLTPRQFAELADLDIEAARLLYSGYAVNQETYGQLISGVDTYKVPLIDMFLYVHDRMEQGYLTLDEDLTDTINDLYVQLSDAQRQLKGTEYSRLVLQLAVPVESDETFAFLDRLHEIVGTYYSDFLVVGDSTSSQDLSDSFANDNLVISLLTIIFVVIVLMFTFQSAGLPVLLGLVIQGSVWINFSFPTLMDDKIFFLSYLVVSSIQMGANIDYAIVIATRYQDLKTRMPLKEAVVESLNEAFPTIITSGTILASAGILIGFLSSSPAISSIGICLGRGTFISIFLVMFVLPQILMLGDVIIEKTAFTLKSRLPVQNRTGAMRLEGHVRGYISGMVDASFSGTVRGTVNAAVYSGSIQDAEEPPPDIPLPEPGKEADSGADS